VTSALTRPILVMPSSECLFREACELRQTRQLMSEPDRTRLGRIGWSSDRNHAVATEATARVAVEHRGYYDLMGVLSDPFEIVEGAAVIPSFRKAAQSPVDFPAVGDWVSIDRGDAARSAPTITAVLDRKSLFVRRAPGREPRAQVVGANIERVFVVTSLDADLSPRRLERYLAVVWGGGAEPVVVLSKSDMADESEVDRAVALVASVAPMVPAVVTSIVDRRGMAELEELVPPALTAALVGSSGVGKSSIINSLLGDQAQAVAATRRDGRGRHTTIRRHLIPTPRGGMIIDTPGMREVQLWNGEGLANVFADVFEAAEQCRFSDCRHRDEPACAVLAAVSRGSIDHDRLAGLHRLVDELDELSDEIARRNRSSRTQRR